jgi:hypothetical protein
MTPALSITEKAIEQRSECGQGLVGGRGTALPRRRSKLARGAWSWLHAHPLLDGSGDGPWDYRFLEDDHRRLARRPQEIAVFWQR